MSNLPHNFDYDSDTLRKELIKAGYQPGPITHTTKRIYLWKLYNLKMNSFHMNNLEMNRKKNPEENRNAPSSLFNNQEKVEEQKYLYNKANNNQDDVSQALHSKKWFSFTSAPSGVGTVIIQDKNLNAPNSIKTYKTKPTINNARKEDIEEVAYKNLPKCEDEFDVFGLSVAFKLRRMKEDQRNLAEYLINKILYYGVCNKLEDSTYICFPRNINNNLMSGEAISTPTSLPLSYDAPQWLNS